MRVGKPSQRIIRKDARQHKRRVPLSAKRMIRDRAPDELLRIFPNARPVADDGDVGVSVGCAASTAFARGAASLDIWTDRRPECAHTEVIIADCGGGFSEACVIKRDAHYRPRKRGPQERKKSREEMSEEDLERSCRRARKTLRQAVKTLKPDRILTLTSREYLQDQDQLWRAWKEFSRLMKKRYGDRWVNVVVPELHKNGKHWHMHVAVRGFMEVNGVRRLWRMALHRTVTRAAQDATPGNIDISWFDKKGSRAPVAIARYMTKYLSKQFHLGEMHRKRYEKTRGLQPVKVRIYGPWEIEDLWIMRKIEAMVAGRISRAPNWKAYGPQEVMLVETEPP